MEKRGKETVKGFKGKSKDCLTSTEGIGYSTVDRESGKRSMRMKDRLISWGVKHAGKRRENDGHTLKGGKVDYHRISPTEKERASGIHKVRLGRHSSVSLKQKKM